MPALWNRKTKVLTEDQRKARNKRKRDRQKFNKGNKKKAVVATVEGKSESEVQEVKGMVHRML